MGAEFLMVSSFGPTDMHGRPVTLDNRVMAELAWARIQKIAITPELVAEYDPWSSTRGIVDDEDIPDQDDYVHERIGDVIGEFIREEPETYSVEWDLGRMKFVTGGMSHGEPPTESYEAIRLMDSVQLWDEPVTDEELAAAGLAARTRVGGVI